MELVTLALTLLTGCWNFGGSEDASEAAKALQPIETELTGNWTANGAGWSESYTFNEDKTYKRYGTTSYVIDSTGKWSAHENAIIFDGYKKTSIEMQLLPGCGAFISNGSVYLRGDSPSSCRASVAPLTEIERCILGRSRDDATTIDLRETRVGRIDWTEWNGYEHRYGIRNVTWAVEGDELVLTDLKTNEAIGMKLQRTKFSVVLDGKYYKNKLPADCTPTFTD